MQIVPSPNAHPQVLRVPRAARMRWIAVVTEVVVGAGAIFGGYGLLSDAEGLGAKQAWLDGGVFPDYTVPGLFLLIVIGGGMLTAAAIAVFLQRRAALAAGAMATVLVLWGVTETVTIGWRGWQQLVLVGAFVMAPAAILARYSARERRQSRAE
jgi:hypothetical protein